jgi:hypothetical protein
VQWVGASGQLELLIFQRQRTCPGRPSSGSAAGYGANVSPQKNRLFRRARFVNPPLRTTPGWFQDRTSQWRLPVTGELRLTMLA